MRTAFQTICVVCTCAASAAPPGGRATDDNAVKYASQAACTRVYWAFQLRRSLCWVQSIYSRSAARAIRSVRTLGQANKRHSAHSWLEGNICSFSRQGVHRGMYTSIRRLFKEPAAACGAMLMGLARPHPAMARSIQHAHVCSTKTAKLTPSSRTGHYRTDFSGKNNTNDGHNQRRDNTDWTSEHHPI